MVFLFSEKTLYEQRKFCHLYGHFKETQRAVLISSAHYLIRQSKNRKRA